MLDFEGLLPDHGLVVRVGGVLLGLELLVVRLELLVENFGHLAFDFSQFLLVLADQGVHFLSQLEILVFELSQLGLGLFKLALKLLDVVRLVIYLLVQNLELTLGLFQAELESLVLLLELFDLLADDLLHVFVFKLSNLRLLLVLQNDLLVLLIFHPDLVCLLEILSVGCQLQLEVTDLLGQHLVSGLFALVKLVKQFWLHISVLVWI